MLGYHEIAAKQIVPTDEPLAPIPLSKYLCVRPIEPTMLAITGKDIYVRRTIANMLVHASKMFAQSDANLRLEVVYGYRHPSIQRANFTAIRMKIALENPVLKGTKLLEAANRFVAAPENAGHPAGAAVDVRLLKNGTAIDMGTESRAFVADTYGVLAIH